jgi:hypothetical protein
VSAAEKPGRVDLNVPWPAYRPADGPWHLFAVSSWGFAATTWLAKVLNDHPEIFCVHALNVVLRQECEPGLDVKGLDYAGLIGRIASGYRFVGDVHGFSPAEIKLLGETFGDKFSGVVLVREPVDRLRSYLAFWATRPHLRADVASVDELAAARGLDPPADDDARFFIQAANMLNRIGIEQDAGPIYRMEDVTTQAEALASLVAVLTGNKAKPNPAWVTAALATGARRAAPGPKPDLTEAQLEIVARTVLPESWRHYEALGYPRPSFVAAG